MVFSNFASYLSPNNKTFPMLPDLGFDVVPHINALWMTDLFTNGVIVPSVAYLLTLDPHPAHSTVRLSQTFSLVYLMRCVALVVTSFPDPRPGCQKVTDNFFTTIVFHRCGDCMFSGHTSALAIFSLYWISQSSERFKHLVNVIRLMVCSSFFFGIWAIIANRAHYTIDVLVAVYVCAGTWWSHAYFLERYFPGKLFEKPAFKGTTASGVTEERIQ